MQGQRSTIDSAPEAFEFDHGSGSSNNGVDRQHIWTDMLNHPFESRLFLSPADAHVTFPHDGRSSSGWNIGEPSSGRSSSTTTDQGAGLRLEERRFAPTNTLPSEHGNINRSNNQVASGPLCVQNTGPSDIPLNNFHVGYVGNHSSQVIEAGVSPQLYKPGESESGSSSASSNASGSAGYFTEEGDGRSGYTQDGRRLSCKRKAFEGLSGQSSSGAGPSYSQQPERNDIPPRYNAGGNLTISAPMEHPSGVNNSPGQLNSRLGAGMRSLPSDNHPAVQVEGNVESSQRNFRMRINPSFPQDSAPSNFSLTGNAVRHPNVWPSHHLPSRFVPFNQSTDSRPTTNTSAPQVQSNAMNGPGPGPGLLRNAHLNPWNGTSDSRVGSISSSTVIPAERPSLVQEINSRRNMQINGSDLPIFVRAEARSWVQDPASWSLANGSVSHTGDTASTSRVGSSSVVHQSPVPAWVPHPIPTQNQQRLPEMLLRSLVTSSGPESGGVSRNFPPLRPGAAPSHEVAFSSGAGHSGHHQPHPHSREAFWMDRLGTPQPFRTSFAGSDGRSRIISEIRHALDIMRRGGETFMFEDLILMDPNVINGVAEMQDRHRDMRLDVDNMSYEELLALEERIGNVNTGLTEETVMKFLKQRKYASATMGAPAEVEPCCICQDEYVEAEDLGALDCGHIFHTGCIRKWLTQKNLCPVCKTTALVT